MINEELKWNKEWQEVNMEVKVHTGTTYYVTAYPFDIYENDNMCVRVYEDKERTAEHECGNGLWCDSWFGWVDGNNELYFEEDSGEDSMVECEILNSLKRYMQREGII